MQRLSDIIKQDRIKAYFTSVQKQKKIPHALMITGDEGSGKYSLAKAFAMNLLCENVDKEDAKEACGICHACKQVTAGTHPDYIEVVHEKEQTISVENIRTQVNATASIRPYQAKYKIYIIDEAKKMNVTAQNALLKTLEEPPEYVCIILLTDNEERMLDTIKSRCIKLRTAPLSKTDVKMYLDTRYAVEENIFEMACIYSNGFIGKAKEFIENEKLQERYMADLATLFQLPFLHLDDLQNLAQEINKSHSDMEEFFTLVRRWYKDILIYKNKEAYGKIEFERWESKIAEIAERISLVQLNHIFQSLDVAQARLRSNVNADLTMQMFLIKCLLEV